MFESGDPMIEDFVSTFFLIFFAEMLDKTQIAVISLSVKYNKMKVFVSAFLALGFVTVLSAILGGVIRAYIPLVYIKLASGFIFIIFGVLVLWSRKAHNNNSEHFVFLNRNVFFGTFTLVTLAELGDKTQISVVLMSSMCNNILLVVAGALLAFFLVTLIGVAIGSGLKRVLESRKELLDVVTAVIFILVGVVLLFSAI